MGSTIFLCFVIISLLTTTEASYCMIEEQVNNCVYTVHCTNRTSSVSVPSCNNIDNNVKFLISGSNIVTVTSSFFGATNFDTRVRSIVAIGNNWTNIETRTFTYYKEATYIDISKNNVKSMKQQVFRSLEKLERLNLSSNIIESLAPYTFYVSDTRPLNVEVLDLSYNRLSSLSTELSRLSSLTVLYLQGNLLHSLETLCFSGLTSLKRLNLEHNSLCTTNKSLTNLNNLMTLQISYNKLIELSGYDTSGLINLQSLNVSHNSIRLIQASCFNSSHVLQGVDFSFNNISSPIYSDMFKYNRELRYVNFFNNSINALSENAFANGSFVFYINLEKNYLKGDFTANTFVGLKNLVQFNLTNQGITSIKEKAFEGMNNLQYLNLTKNKISVISNTSFVNTSISKLDLSYNRISTLNFMKDLSNLTELYINNNDITVVRRLTFFGQNRLRVLDLSMNMILTLEEMSLPLVELQYLNLTGNQLTGVVQKNIFSPAKFLRYLDISNFNITRIEAMAFANLPNLARLNLSHNHIDYIEPNNFVGVNNMYSLDVSNNHLKQLVFISNIFSNLKAVYLNNNELTNISSIFPDPCKLLYLDLSNNNIQNLNGVGANMFPNMTVLRLSNNNIRNFNNPQTNTLTSLVDLQLSSNNLTDITLRYYKELMTLNLSNNSLTGINSTFFENVDYIQALDLSYNNISDLPPGTFKNMRNLKLLNLSSNSLTRLRYGSLQGLHKTELLDISKNKIHLIEIEVFHECVKMNTLILDYNFLTTLDVVGLTNKHLINLKTLSIGGNPISCREVVLTTKSVRAYQVEVTAIDKVYHEDNVHGIKCGNGTSSLAEEMTEEIDTSTKDLTTIMLVTFSVLIVILVATIVVVYLKVFRRRRFVTINQATTVGSLEMESADLSNLSLM